MPAESAADRAAFFNPADFGAVAHYAPAAGGAGADLAGMFDDPARSADLNDVATIDGRPTFFCAEADLPAGAEAGSGDHLTVGSSSLVVISIEPDGQGMALLRLGAAE